MDRWARTCDGVVGVRDVPSVPVEFDVPRGCAENPCVLPPPYP
jgi:hypothetical protein